MFSFGLFLFLWTVTIKKKIIELETTISTHQNTILKLEEQVKQLEITLTNNEKGDEGDEEEAVEIDAGNEDDVDDTDDADDITQKIIAGYLSYKLSDKLEGLVYVDMYDPDTSIENDGNTDLIIGVNYQPSEGLTMTPNLRINTPDEGDASTIFMLNFEFKF